MGIVKKLEEKADFIREKEKKEIEKWNEVKKHKTPPFYLIYFIAVICLAFIVDEIASSINTTFQDNVIAEFFLNHFDITDSSKALSVYTVVLTLVTGVSIFTFLYRTLADRYGRKVFLVINLLGMGVGLFICSLSTNVFLYIGGLIFIYFFTPNDIQVIYILECSPKNKRAFFLALSKSIGVLSLVLISLLRNILMLEHNFSWQLVFVFPSALGFVASLICLLFIKESPVFIESRLNYLIEDLKPKKRRTKKKVSNAQGGFIMAIRYCFMSKSLLWIILVGLIFSISVIGVSNYAEILHQFSFNNQDITKILFYFPLSASIVILSSGILSELLGRKPSAIYSSFLCFLSIVLFYLSCYFKLSVPVIGICLGVFLGGFSSMSDIYNVLVSEHSPTNLRASILSFSGAAFSLGSFISTVILLLWNFFVENNLGLITMIVIAPSCFLSMLILVLKVNETKRISLEDVNIKQMVKKKKVRQR